MLEVDEHLERRPAEGPLELRQKLLERNRRHLALQPLELGGPLRREQVLAGGEHLPELDESRAEFLQREPHPLLRLEARGVAGFSPVQYLAGTLE